MSSARGFPGARPDGVGLPADADSSSFPNTPAVTSRRGFGWGTRTPRRETRPRTQTRGRAATAERAQVDDIVLSTVEAPCKQQPIVRKKKVESRFQKATRGEPACRIKRIFHLSRHNDAHTPPSAMPSEAHTAITGAVMGDLPNSRSPSAPVYAHDATPRAPPGRWSLSSIRKMAAFLMRHSVVAGLPRAQRRRLRWTRRR